MNGVITLNRARVLQIEEQINLLPIVWNELPLEHYFGHKCYMRQIVMPKDTVLTGVIHKYKQIHILLVGELSILTDIGPIRIKAPYIFMAPAGSKRAVFAHEESVWLSVHGTEKVDPEEIMEEITSKTFEEFDQFCKEQS